MALRQIGRQWIRRSPRLAAVSKLEHPRTSERIRPMPNPEKKVIETITRMLDLEERSVLMTVVSRVVAQEKENFKSQLKLGRLFEIIDAEGVDFDLEKRAAKLRGDTQTWQMMGGQGPRPRMGEKEIRGEEKEYIFPLPINSWITECLKKGNFSNYVQRDQEGKIVESVPMMPAIVTSLLEKFGIRLEE
jgi:hypothetical protein